MPGRDRLIVPFSSPPELSSRRPREVFFLFWRFLPPSRTVAWVLGGARSPPSVCERSRSSRRLADAFSFDVGKPCDFHVAKSARSRAHARRADRDVRRMYDERSATLVEARHNTRVRRRSVVGRATARAARRSSGPSTPPTSSATPRSRGSGGAGVAVRPSRRAGVEGGALRLARRRRSRWRKPEPQSGGAPATVEAPEPETRGGGREVAARRAADALPADRPPIPRRRSRTVDLACQISRPRGPRVDEARQRKGVLIVTKIAVWTAGRPQRDAAAAAPQSTPCFCRDGAAGSRWRAPSATPRAPRRAPRTKRASPRSATLERFRAESAADAGRAPVYPQTSDSARPRTREYSAPTLTLIAANATHNAARRLPPLTRYTMTEPTRRRIHVSVWNARLRRRRPNRSSRATRARRRLHQLRRGFGFEQAPTQPRGGSRQRMRLDRSDGTKTHELSTARAKALNAARESSRGGTERRPSRAERLERPPL